MKILADENVARDIVAWLRSTGHDVLFAAEANAGADDIEWAARGEQEQRVILTSDKDFGELVFRQGRAHGGVALLRLHGLESAEKTRIAVAAVAQHGVDLISAFAVIEKDRIRIRRSRAN